MAPPIMTEAQVRNLATSRSFEHGESILDRGQSKYYHHAANRLEKARRAYLAANRADDWRTYLEGLMRQHNRKRALRPRLEALR